MNATAVKRVVIIGSESNGTTTLARALAAHYRTVWVPEYGRTYSEGRQHVAQPWRSDEFVHIATEQIRMEDAIARLANKVLICDTDAFATSIWNRSRCPVLPIEDRSVPSRFIARSRGGSLAARRNASPGSRRRISGQRAAAAASTPPPASRTPPA